MNNKRAHMGINDQAALWAVRYCMGRRTYAVDDCSRWLVSVWPNLHQDANPTPERIAGRAATYAKYEAKLKNERRAKRRNIAACKRYRDSIKALPKVRG